MIVQTRGPGAMATGSGILRGRARAAGCLAAALAALSGCGGVTAEGGTAGLGGGEHSDAGVVTDAGGTGGGGGASGGSASDSGPGATGGAGGSVGTGSGASAGAGGGSVGGGTRPPVCGNGRLDPDESCDGDAFPSTQCGYLSMGLVFTGKLFCTEQCAIQFLDCSDPRDGTPCDGTLCPPRSCDPAFCPSVGTATGCCLPSVGCGVDYGLGCVPLSLDGGR